MARLIDADALTKNLEWYCDPARCDSYNGVRCRACLLGDALNAIEDAPTAFDVKMLMMKLATLDRIARSDKQKALLGRVFFIIENMIEENEKEQNDEHQA